MEIIKMPQKQKKAGEWKTTELWTKFPGPYFAHNQLKFFLYKFNLGRWNWSSPVDFRTYSRIFPKTQLG